MSVTNSTPSVSIIVPIYNVEKYLSKCLNSIIGQTMSDFELILVNDASPDNSLSICQKYALRDKRIKIIDKVKNEGLDKARFDGLLNAIGEYIFFVDSDDWIPQKALSTLYSAIKEYNVDMVIGAIKKVGLYGLLKLPYYNTKRHSNRVIGSKELMDKYFLSFFGVNILPCNAYGRIYKKELFIKSGIGPGFYKFGEDIMMNMKLFPYLSYLYIIDEPVYYYRMGSGGTAKFMGYWMETIKTEYKEKKGVLEKHHYDTAFYYLKIELLNALVYYVDQFIRFKPEDKQHSIDLLALELKDPIYEEIYGIDCSKKECLRFIEEKDAEKLYERREDVYRHRPLRQKILSFVRSVINKLL